jgi:hypothetical protein
MIIALAAATLAAPPGYRVTEADVDGCELSLGPADGAGNVPMHASCWWPDVTVDKFKSKLQNWELHDDIWTAVASSDVVRTEGEKSLVHQVHQNKGIANREVLLWMWHEAVDGADRYAWTLATGEPLTPADGDVATVKDDGYWQVKADSRGGSAIEHEMVYDPGGSVPGFVVHWFQTSGLKANLAELHAVVR